MAACPASGPTGSDDPREVLSSLPRSRRQRPTARREAARAKRASASAAPATAKPAAKPKPAVKAAAKAKPAATSAAKASATAAKPARRPAAKTAPKPRTATKAAVRPRPAKRAIPPAGYATPRTKGAHGSADPGAALGGPRAQRAEADSAPVAPRCGGGADPPVALPSGPLV